MLLELSASAAKYEFNFTPGHLAEISTNDRETALKINNMHARNDPTRLTTN